MIAAEPTALTIAGAALLGLIVGSFLNVVIHRLPAILERRWQLEAQEILGDDADPEGEAYHLAWPPSHCPQCGRRLGWRENIPLLSYLLQRGRCRGCSGRIALRYPIVEGLAAVATALVVATQGLTLAGLGAVVLTWALIAAAVIDYEHYLLPDALTLPLLWLGLLWSIVTPGLPTPSDAIIGAAAGYTAMWAIYHGHRAVTGREGMGHGDFKLTAALGAWLGWQALPMVVLVAALGGLAVALVLALRRRPLGQPVPFGPSLAAAGWLLLILDYGGTSWRLL